MLKIAIVAGEASGDLVASGVMRAIRASYPSVVFEGIAGPSMMAEGCIPLFKIEDLSVMGVWEVLAKLPKLLSIRNAVKNHFRQNRPDIFIGIDAPDFNLNIEAFLQKQGVKTVHYNSPTVWAWRKNRLKTIKPAVSLMLTLFPFEAAIYEAFQIPVQFIGHPLADSLPKNPDVTGARQALGIDLSAKVIALLPGSRASEIKQLGRLFLETAQWCLDLNPHLRFIVPMVNEARLAQFQALCLKLPKGFPIQAFVGSSQTVITAADAVLVASGTATLETALLQKPMVVAYRLNYFNYHIARLLIKIPYFSLPNLLLNKPAVPEFFQGEATPEHLGQALVDQLMFSKGVELFKDFEYLRTILAKSSDERAARAVLDLITARN